MAKRVVSDGKGGTKELDVKRFHQSKTRAPTVEFTAREVVPLTDRKFKTTKEGVFQYHEEPSVPSGLDDDGVLFDRFGKYMLVGIEHVFRYIHMFHLVPAGAKVLEVGCGYAELGKLLYTERKACTYVGMDIAGNKLRRAINLRWGSSKTMFVQRDLSKPLPFADGSFDFVVSSEFIEHVPKKYARRALREMYRVLRPGGRALFTTPANDWGEVDPVHIFEFSHAEGVEAYERAGFEIVSKFGLKLGGVGTRVNKFDEAMKSRDLVGSPKHWRAMRAAMPSSFAKCMFAFANPEQCWLWSALCEKKDG